MKTIREWVETLIPPYKEIALRYLDNNIIGYKVRLTFKDAIWALDWSRCQSSLVHRISWSAIANHPELYTGPYYKKYLKETKSVPTPKKEKV